MLLPSSSDAPTSLMDRIRRVVDGTMPFRLARQFDSGLRRGLAVALRAEADVEDEHAVFLKTIIPSRKATKQDLGEESDDEDGR